MESIETLNARLKEYFGIDTASSQPMFRIVWSEDQFENRLTDKLDSGITLLFPVIRLCRKYNYLKDLYILERLVVVPDEQVKELAGLKVSYEPLFAYSRSDGTPLPPTWEATKFVVDTVHAAMGKKSLRKYTEDVSVEAQDARINQLQLELFGNETDTGDALAYKEGVTVPEMPISKEIN